MTKDALVYSLPHTDDEVHRMARLVSLSFGSPVAGAEQWLRDAGLEHLRQYGAPGEPAAACLLRIPMGQYYGGRRLPMLGLAGVAVAPEHRGGGHCRRMVAAYLDEARRDGYPIACLYPSTQTLYRSLGYELAGSNFLYKIRLDSVPGSGPTGLRTIPIDDVDDRVRACRDRFAARMNGALDRGPYCWKRVKVRHGEVHDGYGLAAEDGTFEAYAFVAQKVGPGGLFETDLTVSDLAFTTPRGGRALLGLLRSFGTISREVIFAGGALHPLALMLPHQRFVEEKQEHWMLRVTDVAKALEGRGYPRHVEARLALDVDDDVLATERGRYTLAVSRGEGRVIREGVAGVPTLRVGPRGLAALFTGFVPAPELAFTGLAEGDDDALDTAISVFGGSAPWTSDFF